MLDQSTPKVSIVLLNLNGYQDTRDCLESLQQVRYSNLAVIVVDNGSSDNSFARLQREFPEAKLIRSEENLGFSGGNNLGMKYALEDSADYVLLLNNDTVVDPDFLNYLVQVGESDPRIGILGPKIFYFSEPKRIWYAGGYVKFGSGTTGHLGQDQLDQEEEFSRVEDTGFVTGCSMMIKSTLLQEIGLLDAKLFIYWEDADFCMRAKDIGKRLVFVPTALVWHKVSRTCGVESPFSLYLTTRNQLIWISRHVPFPYKPFALAWVSARKFLKAVLLASKSRELGVALCSGIWAFLFRIYGPPRKDRPLAVSASVSNWSLTPQPVRDKVLEKGKE